MLPLRDVKFSRLYTEKKGRPVLMGESQDWPTWPLILTITYADTAGRQLRDFDTVPILGTPGTLIPVRPWMWDIVALTSAISTGHRNS